MKNRVSATEPCARRRGWAFLPYSHTGKALARVVGWLGLEICPLGGVRESLVTPLSSGLRGITPPETS